MIQSVKMALKSVAANKLRAFLTMLGIIIGVMALVILVSLVGGATSSVTDTINSLGTNRLTVTISDDKGLPIRVEDLQEWMKEKKLGLIAPASTESVTGKVGSKSDTVSVCGTTAAYEKIQGLSVRLGRFLKTSDVENHTSVCVISDTLAQNLVGYSDCLGEVISLNGQKLTIVGVLAEDSSSLTGVFSGSTLVAYVPYTTLVRFGSATTLDVSTFYVSAAEDSDMDTAKTVMENLLYDRLDKDEDAYEVNSQNALENAMGSVTGILAVLLGGIAAISLVVGGIGIMNIMLVTVTERTREIGIRKAIGASRGAILLQFLVEAVVLCMMGCAIGIFLSWCVLHMISTVVSGLDLTFVMDGSVVLIAVVFCFLIGVVFGLYPANKAARMKPIDALHYGG